MNDDLDFDDRLERARELLLSTGVDRPPDGTPAADQLHAAERDAQRLFGALAATGAGTAPVDREALAHLIAAAWDCTPCAHIRNGSSAVPVVVDLNIGHARCPRCIKTFRKPLLNCACEICWEPEPDCRLVPIEVRAGATVFIGAAGVACCAGLFEP